MDRKFHCYSCKKELEFFQIRQLPGQEIFDPRFGIPYNTANNYCEECYKERTISVEKTKPTSKEITHISDLEVNQTNIDLLITVTKKELEKETKKYGRNLRLGVFLVKDKSGEIKLTLWNEIIDQVKEGETLCLENCFVREWQGEKQLTLGKGGRIKKID